MKVGDLVKIKMTKLFSTPVNPARLEADHAWTGLIIDIDGDEPIVYWNEQYPAERESLKHIWVIND